MTSRTDIKSDTLPLRRRGYADRERPPGLEAIIVMLSIAAFLVVPLLLVGSVLYAALGGYRLAAITFCFGLTIVATMVWISRAHGWAPLLGGLGLGAVVLAVLWGMFSTEIDLAD